MGSSPAPWSGRTQDRQGIGGDPRQEVHLRPAQVPVRGMQGREYEVSAGPPQTDCGRTVEEELMAIVNLKDVTVERLNRTGYGVKVAEKYQVQGNDRKTTYTVWFKEPHGLNEGDIISVSGFLGAKVGDPWTGQDGQERRSVELSLNEPRIQGQQAGG